MLTNVVRLIGALRKRIGEGLAQNVPAAARTLVVLPLSPNHGVFGGDGLYAESKIALEALFQKWKSENWAHAIALCGAEIGWTRGTFVFPLSFLAADPCVSPFTLLLNE